MPSVFLCQSLSLSTTVLYDVQFDVLMDAVVTISLEQLQDLTDENSNSLSLSVTKSNTTSIDVIVEVTVTDGTAIGKHIICTQQCLLVCIYTGGMDYTVTASVFNVTISAGATSSSFNIDINDDITHEDNETFNVAIRLLPSCLSLSLNVSSSTVTIIDDDGRYIHTYNIKYAHTKI